MIPIDDRFIDESKRLAVLWADEGYPDFDKFIEDNASAEFVEYLNESERVIEECASNGIIVG